MIDLYASINEISTAIRERILSPVALTGACLERIETINPHLNAFITVTADAARAAAVVAESEIQAGRWRGPLHGIPIAVKDFYDTAGVRTTAGFERFANRVPAKDADVVTRLKNAGAILIGKTNMDTLGTGTTGLVSFFGPVKNPWNAHYIPGGSSSGSAAAVSSGLCFATVDTDAIGSCRLPSACCGVVGFKGTYGLISTEGILGGEAPPDEMLVWLSHVGVTTRRVADTAVIVDVLKNEGTAPRPSMQLGQGIHESRGLRVAAANNFKADQNVVAAFTAAVQTLIDLGYHVKDTSVSFAGPASGLQHIERDREGISRELFDDIDVVLLPTTTTTVPRVVAATQPQGLSAENTAFANYYGLPAITVPCAFDANGLPLGLQMVAKPSADLDVLTLAHQYEIAAGWFRRHPTL